MSSRMTWMDSLRGIAIVLVLFWHAPAIPAHVGLDMPDWVRVVNDAFIPFRMPTLMFLSGLLLVRSLKKPLAAYYVGKLRLIAWPYFLFALLHNLTFEAVAPLWHPRAWIATGYLWFLFFILVYYLVAPLLRWVPPLLLPILCLVGSLIVREGIWHELLYFAVFFFAGYAAASHQAAFDRIVRNNWVALAGAVAAVALAVWSTTHDIQFHAEFAIVSLAGVLAAIWLMSRVGDARWTRPLQFVGRNSIVYYTTHFPLMNAAMLALLAIGVSATAALAPVLFVFALGGGTLLARFRHSPWVAWLFEAPLPRRRQPAASPPQ